MGLPSHSIHMHVSKADGSEEGPLYHHPLQSVLPFCYSALVSALHTKTIITIFIECGLIRPRERLQPLTQLSRGAVTTASATYNRFRNVCALAFWIKILGQPPLPFP